MSLNLNLSLMFKDGQNLRDSTVHASSVFKCILLSGPWRQQCFYIIIISIIIWAVSGFNPNVLATLNPTGSGGLVVDSLCGDVTAAEESLPAHDLWEQMSFIVFWLRAEMSR